MGLLGLGNIFNGFRRSKGTRSNPIKPNIPLFNTIANPIGALMEEFGRPSHYITQPIPNNSGYILLTNKRDHDKTFLGRHLEFDSNRGTFNRGETEKVMLDGHVIWEDQIRNTSMGKLRREFFDDYDIQQLTKSQVGDIMADEDDDPQMFGQTARVDEMVENELSELRAELEAEYVERFEEDYQARWKQEYPEQFSKDYQEHYNEMVVDELDDVVDDHEELYEEYIVSPKHIRYKR